MTICMIAAVGKNLELGKDNNLIWHFKDDMAFFKETTTGSSIIMGRKTFESLPRRLSSAAVTFTGSFCRRLKSFI